MHKSLNFYYLSASLLLEICNRMDGWSVTEWVNGARRHRRLPENSDRFRRIKIVRMNMVNILDGRLTNSEKNEAMTNMNKVYHAMQTSMLESDKMECAICLNMISYEAVITDCGHVFHYHCQLKWETISKKCAICRQDSNKSNRKMGVQGLWLKFTGKMTIQERIQATAPLAEANESK